MSLGNKQRSQRIGVLLSLFFYQSVTPLVIWFRLGICSLDNDRKVKRRSFLADVLLRVGRPGAAWRVASWVWALD
ncbi:hypothetical protein C8F01DRAFT_1125782 [Mycena amicta]|nr:hypothetical protein C8F01DRAFT_1125782 [Mycena amicta]